MSWLPRKAVWRSVRRRLAAGVVLLSYLAVTIGLFLATLLGISENTVKQHLFRAIEALRRALRHGERDPADPVST